jgi:hypothetical protein
MTLEIRNYTPFVPFAFEKQGKGREACEVVIIKGTFDLIHDQVTIAAEQQLPVLADQYYDEPETSSLALEGDLVMVKPATDIYVTGHAQALGGEAVCDWVAQIEISQPSDKTSSTSKVPGEMMLRHTLYVCGPRYWEAGVLGGWRLSKPEPVAAIPLKYELAFGGQFERQVKISEQHPEGVMIDTYAPNPVGVGYYDPASMLHDQRYPAPLILRQGEILNSPEDRPLPAGTTPISRWWPQRYHYAGTYDERWERTWKDEQGQRIEGVFPALPEDFDYRFYNAAHPSLIWPSFMRGDETIRLQGLLPEGPLETSLMGLRLLGILQGGEESGRTEAFKLDTLHIDLDARKVMLTWRLTVLQSLGAERVQVMFAYQDEGLGDDENVSPNSSETTA